MFSLISSCKALKELAVGRPNAAADSRPRDGVIATQADAIQTAGDGKMGWEAGQARMRGFPGNFSTMSPLGSMAMMPSTAVASNAVKSSSCF
jgi:hypothetical protein